MTGPGRSGGSRRGRAPQAASPAGAAAPDDSLVACGGPAPTTRACAGCGGTVELGRVTCPACYERDFQQLVARYGRVLVHRMAVLGLAGSGKTVYLSQLFWHLWNDLSANADFPWEVHLETPAALDLVRASRARIERGEWPQKTGALDEGPIQASVYPRSGGRYFLRVDDVAGETVQRFLREARSPASDPVRGRYLAHLFSAQSLLLVLDGARPESLAALDLEAFAAMYQREHAVTAPRDVWLAIVVTKADLLVGEGGAPPAAAVARRALRSGLERLRRTFRHVEVFLVSAVGKTLPGGAPDPLAVPAGLEAPLVWILSGIEAHARAAGRGPEALPLRGRPGERGGVDASRPGRETRFALALAAVLGLVLLGLIALLWSARR